MHPKKDRIWPGGVAVGWEEVTRKESRQQRGTLSNSPHMVAIRKGGKTTYLRNVNSPEPGRCSADGVAPAAVAAPLVRQLDALVQHVHEVLHDGDARPQGGHDDCGEGGGARGKALTCAVHVCLAW